MMALIENLSKFIVMWHSFSILRIWLDWFHLQNNSLVEENYDSTEYDQRWNNIMVKRWNSFPSSLPSSFDSWKCFGYRNSSEMPGNISESFSHLEQPGNICKPFSHLEQPGNSFKPFSHLERPRIISGLFPALRECFQTFDGLLGWCRKLTSQIPLSPTSYFVTQFIFFNTVLVG